MRAVEIIGLMGVGVIGADTLDFLQGKPSWIQATWTYVRTRL
jgi:homoserine dehydrogenase